MVKIKKPCSQTNFISLLNIPFQIFFFTLSLIPECHIKALIPKKINLLAICSLNPFSGGKTNTWHPSSALLIISK